MLYVAYIKNKPRAIFEDVDMMAKSRKWWNEGDRPAGIKTVAFYGALATQAPDVYVFECDNHNDIRRMIDYWQEVDFEIHPAVDLADNFRKQGMNIA